MAVAFDFTNNASTTTSTSSLTWSHTCASSAVLLVGVNVDNASGTPTAAVTYGGVSMAQLTSVSYVAGCPLFLFGLTTPASGANNVAVTITTGAGADAIVGGSLSFTGAGSFGTPATATGDSNTGTSTISTTTGGNICAAFNAVGNTIDSVASPAVSEFIDNVKGGSGGSSGNLAGAINSSTGSSLTTTWTYVAGNHSWATVGVEVLAAVAAIIPVAWLYPIN